MAMRLTNFGDIDGSLWSLATNPDLKVGKIEYKKVVEKEEPKIFQESSDEWVSSSKVYIPGTGWTIRQDRHSQVGDTTFTVTEYIDIPKESVNVGESITFYDSKDEEVDESYLEKQVEVWRANGVEVELREGNHYELRESELPEGYVLDNEDREAIIKTLAHVSSPTEVFQKVSSQMLNVLTIMLIVVASLLVIDTGLKYAIIGVSKSTNNYDKAAYRQSVDVINQFSSYKKFQRSMKWWVWRNRGQYATEINNLFIAIADSPYKDDLHYQYEVIQLFPKRKKLKRLLKDDNLKQLIDEIDRLTKTYWAIDF